MSILVQKPAPDFTCAAVLPDGSITEDFRLHRTLEGKYGVLVFYPLDFTFVCPTELIALDHRVELLAARGATVVAVSIDSQFTHHAWRSASVDAGGIGPVRFAMAADTKHEICRAYGVETEAGVALRATFVIDRQGIVRAQLVHDLPLGRNMDEVLRILDALQFHEAHGEVCPAGWSKGEGGMIATPEGVASWLSARSEEL